MREGKFKRHLGTQDNEFGKSWPEWEPWFQKVPSAARESQVVVSGAEARQGHGKSEILSRSVHRMKGQLCHPRGGLQGEYTWVADQNTKLGPFPPLGQERDFNLPLLPSKT